MMIYSIWQTRGGGGGKHRFITDRVKYFGGPAHFLIYNSLIFRIPLGLKPIIAPPLMFIERLYNKLPGKLLYPNFLARWKKLPS
jgi:hypothetical protein